MIVLAIVSLLVVALLGGALVLFETKAMWKMDSPNARTWNATLNASATFGISIIPLLLVAIVGFMVIGVMSSYRGF